MLPNTEVIGAGAALLLAMRGIWRFLFGNLAGPLDPTADCLRDIEKAKHV